MYFIISFILNVPLLCFWFYFIIISFYLVLFSCIFFFAFNVRLIFRWPNLLLWLNQSENYRPVGDQGRASTGNSLNGGLQHRNLI